MYSYSSVLMYLLHLFRSNRSFVHGSHYGNKILSFLVTEKGEIRETGYIDMVLRLPVSVSSSKL